MRVTHSQFPFSPCGRTLGASKMETTPPQPHSELHTPVTIIPTMAVYLFYSPRTLKRLEYGIRTNDFQIEVNHTEDATQIPGARQANRRSKSEGNRDSQRRETIAYPPPAQPVVRSVLMGYVERVVEDHLPRLRLGGVLRRGPLVRRADLRRRRRTPLRHARSDHPGSSSQGHLRRRDDTDRPTDRRAPARDRPLRATQTSPRDRWGRQVGPAGTQSRLTSASRRFFSAGLLTHTHTHTVASPSLPHLPDSENPPVYPAKNGGKSFGFRFVLFFLGSARFCGREWGLVLEAVAAMKLRGSFLRRITLPHGPAHGQDRGSSSRRGGGPPVSDPCPAGSNDRNRTLRITRVKLGAAGLDDRFEMETQLDGFIQTGRDPKG